MLRAAWVDGLFAKLSVRYGRDFLARYEGLDLDVVKADWAEVLAHYDNHPDAIKHALSLLPAEKPPTAAQFRDLCRMAPGPVFQALPPPKLGADVAAQRAEELRALKRSIAARQMATAAVKVINTEERSAA